MCDHQSLCLVSVVSPYLALQPWECKFALWKAVMVCYPKNREWEGAGIAQWSVGVSEKGLTMHKRGEKGEKMDRARRVK